MPLNACTSRHLQEAIIKRFLTCLCLVVMSLALCSGLAGAAEKVRINLLSTPFGTGSYVLGTACLLYTSDAADE